MLNDLSCCPQTLNAHISLPHAHIATCTCSIQLCQERNITPPPPNYFYIHTLIMVSTQLKINDYFNNGFVTGVAYLQCCDHKGIRFC